MVRSLTIAAGLAVLAFHPSLRADVMAYAVDATHNLYSVDLTTATATTIGSTGQFLEGLAFSPGGTLYATDDAGNLYTLNTATGAATLVGSTGLGDIEGLAFDGSTLLGTNLADPATIYSINTSNADATTVVNTNTGAVRAMSLLDSNDVYVTSDTPVHQSLETIDLTTGGVTDIGQLGDSNLVAALAYNGDLYGLDSAGNVVTIDQSNASTTLVGNAGGHFYLDATLVPAAVPEPSSVLLLFSVICGVGVSLRKKLS